MSSSTVLVVEDDYDLREALCETLDLENYDYVAAESGSEALKILSKNSIGLVISDVNMPGMDGVALLEKTKLDYPNLPVILMTAYGNVAKAVSAMQHGAADYIAKPFEPQCLVEKIQSYLKQYPPEVEDQDGPIAYEPSSQQLLTLARKVALSNSTVLITGESGTGKEVLAKYIHDYSQRNQGSFIAINCAAIPENMLEATLFGHEKGAFTGAHQSSPGKFELANGGTILLDEISEMDLSLQAKLLRVLQEREVERIGGKKTIKLDIRVLATSNKDLKREVQEGRFREDLFYRLNVFPLQWKPLRERERDVVPLAEAIVKKYSSAEPLTVQLDVSAKKALLQYSWPGNVRELDNTIQRALILKNGSSITEADLMIEATKVNVAIESSHVEQDTAIDSAFDSNRHPVLIHDSANADTSNAESIGIAEPATDEGGLGGDLRKREFEVIISTLKEVSGSRKNAAEKLGISTRTLRYKLAKMREHGIDLASAIRI
ncbi:MAG: sigma-54 dependent transcriptional regulator [Pseudomonadales bacterium]|nr:sigma-54 dependent transcriptional regulator [Pseudomonadales bacterium]